MEENKELELRAYFFVPYNISPIQQAIQAGHAAIDYAFRYGDSEEFKLFAQVYKTWIILDGGTTNERRDLEGIVMGSLNQIADDLQANDIQFAFFQEPDLNDALTALCFICDERVFNRKDYPDFVDYILDVIYPRKEYIPSPQSVVILRMDKKPEETYSEYYKEWVRFVGGVQNVFLRELIKDKRLA